MRKRNCLVWITLLLTITATTVGCRRGRYPSREIEFIIPFPPGGPADTAARIIQPRISQLLGVAVVLVNKAGGGGALGADYVVKGTPDGYRVFATTNNTLTILPAIQQDLTYQVGDFTPIGSYLADLNVIATRADKPWKTLDQLVEYATKNPGKLNYGSAGAGTVSFFTMELLKLSLGVDIVHVPFQGTAPAKTALLGGHVDVSAGGFASFGPLLKSGDLVPLVTTAVQRLPEYPDLPTMAEKGFPEASLNIWMGLFVPSATPSDVVDKLALALEETMKDPSIIRAVGEAGLVVDYRNPDATRELLESESQAIREAVDKLGIGN